MRRFPVQSSSIASVGYDARTRTLEVEFTSAEVYQYFEVPVRAHEAFLAAPSLGTYLNQEIKGRYRYTRL